jgi:PilZ domain
LLDLVPVNRLKFPAPRHLRFEPTAGSGERLTLNASAKNGLAGTARARRYDIGTAVRYRVRGQREWHEGVMENISYSGVLIRTSQFFPPDTNIEMRFFLPVELDGERAAEVLCRGSIVRSTPSTKSAGAVKVAARITHSRFIRQTGPAEDVSRDSLLGGGNLFD